jgi:hypothetical protein
VTAENNKFYRQDIKGLGPILERPTTKQVHSRLNRDGQHGNLSAAAVVLVVFVFVAAVVVVFFVLLFGVVHLA